MKKYFLAIGLVAFLMTSCCEKQENNENKECCKEKKEQCDKHHECDHHNQMPPMCPEMMQNIDKMVEGLANWENLDETQQAEIIGMAKKMQEMKANMPKENCEHHHEGECEHHHDGCQHQHEGCDHQHEGCDHQHENCEHHQDK